MLVLDEPGNHLDVDTVEALAEALLEYKGTVIFTSHDRHFMKRVATCIIEVRDGRVTNYRGDYEAYLYSVNKEIDDGERERRPSRRQIGRGQAGFRQSRRGDPAAAKPTGKASGSKSGAGQPTDKPPAAEARPGGRDERDCARRWAIPSGRLPGSTRKSGSVNSRLLEATDPDEALRLHHELGGLARQLAEAEDRWCKQQEELGEQ